ncbi:hypothetical protein C0995_013829 [Termitomyces sp. Mi166|nr:hypothetical protein C0995_013829 [Termitomyces sp. Mi166\
MVTRYVFPEKPAVMGGVIDLDEKPFYMNSYSGEMSLEFPRSEGVFLRTVLLFVSSFFFPN